MKMDLVAAAAALGLATVAAPATATTLFNVTDLDASTTYEFNVTATQAATQINFGGYNVPSFLDVSDIDFYAATDPATNLLGPVWTFTAAPSGSDSGEFNDGTSVPALSFGSVVVGSYDFYSQIVATMVGGNYVLTFNYDNARDPSGLIVSTGSIPEPATWALMIGGFGLVGTALRRRTAALAA